MHDALEALRPRALTVALEPFRLDQAAAQRGGGLLILTGEVVLADRPADMLPENWTAASWKILV